MDEWIDGRDLPRTTEWMLWKRASRHVLADSLKDLKPGSQQKIVFQAISNVFPTQVNLHRWDPKKHTSKGCPLGCGATAETFGHIQCSCPCLQKQRIAAHNRIWDGVLSDFRKYFPHKNYTLTREETIKGVIRAIRTAGRPDAETRELVDGLQWICSEKTHPETELRDASALGRIVECGVLQSGRMGRGREGERGSEAAGRTGPDLFFPKLTDCSVFSSIFNRTAYDTLTSDPGTSRSSAATAADSMTCPDTLRRRPDGWMIDWRRKKIVILEFTRPYDYSRKDLAIANIKKLLKYTALQRLIERYIPEEWQVSIAAFSVGVKGSADEPAWRAGLRELGIDTRYYDTIARHMIDETLASLCDIVGGRYALLQERCERLEPGVRPPPD